MPKVEKIEKSGSSIVTNIEKSSGLMRDVWLVLYAIHADEHVKEVQPSVIKEAGKKIEVIYVIFERKVFDIPEEAKKFGIKDTNEFIIAAVHNYWGEGRDDIKTVEVAGKLYKTQKTTGIKTTILHKGTPKAMTTIQFIKMPTDEANS